MIFRVSLKVFISSVQREFAEERTTLYNHFLHNALLSEFFENRLDVSNPGELTSELSIAKLKVDHARGKSNCRY